MFRTIMALLLCLVVAVVIGAFQIVGLDIAGIQAIIGSTDITGELAAKGALLFGGLLFPYTAATAATPIYSPLVALGVAGFIAGLISKSGVRMLFVSLIAMVLFFLGYYVLTLALSPTDLDAMLTIARNMAIDIGVAFGLLFIPGIIGASLTSEDY
jgi:hypothetical protein